MFELITDDIKKAMLAREKERLDALRYFKSMLIENKTSKTPIGEMDVLIKHVKKLKDSLENFPPENEIRKKTEREILILSDYMPKQLDEATVKAYIQEIITNNPAVNAGLVMKELSPKIKGQFDSKIANELVKAALA
ncbi:MAG: GatB/YqeY domain-containing protein [Bacteriovoracaceae bacterium]|nr:GatB/YqeY domain-containing protein [Bacteriovoracaceae bacterium]